MFLKNNFKQISSAILESCTNTPGVIIGEPTYDENPNPIEHGIKVAIQFTPVNNTSASQKPKKHVLAYLEKDHNQLNDDKSLNEDKSWESFLNDINTDLKMLDITSAFPDLEISGWSWPDQRVTLRDGTELYSFDKYFNLETGDFNITRFLEEKNTAQQSRGDLRFFATRGGTRGAAAEPSANLPTSYTSTLKVKITFDKRDAAIKVQASTAEDNEEQSAAFMPGK